MKKIYFIICPIMCCLSVFSQPDNSNYVKTITYLDDTGSNYITSVQYYDGLGRPSLSATNGLANDGKYTYTLQTYDMQGREKHTYFPVSSINLESVMPELNEYNRTTTNYDVLNRIISSNRGGEEWNNKNSSIQYTANNANDVAFYKLENVASGIMPTRSWQTGSLTVETVTDEDGHTVKTYKDMFGNVILERRAGMETYYVYDDTGHLRYVLPPHYQSTRNLDDVYAYTYDSHNRLKSKKIPGCASVEYEYDNEGRVAIMQDGLLAEKGIYRFFLYDQFGRLCIQGTCSDYTLGNYYSATVHYSSVNGIGKTGYTLTEPNAFRDFSNVNIEIANYYDRYTFIKSVNTLMSDIISKTESSTIPNNNSYSNGMLTGQITAATNGEYMFSSFYYDQKGNVIDKYYSTIDNKVYHTTTEYTFTNKPKRITKVLSDGYDISTVYTYNTNNDQPQTITVTLNNGTTSQVISELTYDDFGQVKTDSRTAISDNIEYTYNLHGWTKKIAGSYFTEELFYADGTGTPCYNGNISSMLWQSASDIKNNHSRGYMYTYNSNGMLERGVYADGSNLNGNLGIYTEAIETNGPNNAISSLKRYGKRNSGLYGGLIDDLVYTYDGNKLINIHDNYTTKLSYAGAFEYRDVNASATSFDFEYNSSGMLTRDLDKGISKITYNDIGLTDSIVFSNGAYIKYVYSMAGEKLKVTHYDQPKVFHPDPIYELENNHAIDPVPPHVIASGNTPKLSPASSSPAILPNFMSPSISLPISDSNISVIVKTEERSYLGSDIQINTKTGEYTYLFGSGYVTFKPNSTSADPKFYYYAKDHLGNIRSVVIADNGTAKELQSTHYYPFGGIIADISTGRGVQNRLYNGKELDTSNNLWWYDYGARQYASDAPRFVGLDPLCEKFYSWSPYIYCMNNPVNAIDLDGNLTVFINGFHNGFNAGKIYWSRFAAKILNSFKETKTPIYRDGSINGMFGLPSNLSSNNRYTAGYERGQLDVELIISNLLRDKNGNITEALRIVSHSMGGAYAKGYIKAIIEYAKRNPRLCEGLNITEYDFAPFQPYNQSAIEGVDTYQFSHYDDQIAGFQRINGATNYNSWGNPHNIFDISTKAHSIDSFIGEINQLPEGKYIYKNGQFIKIN